MPSLPLPLNIQVHVLSHIEWDGRETNDDSRALACCRLVCKAWSHLCRRKLLRTVFLRDWEGLNSVVASLTSQSATHLICTYITQLDLYHDMCHVAPLYLAKRLPSLRRLVLWRPETHTPLIVRSSLVMHLKHFRTVSELVLDNITFQSFWDFHRLTISLPALSFLQLLSVDLLDSDPFHSPHGRVPSLFAFPQSLTELYVQVPSGWNPLWIWITPFQTRRLKLSNPCSRPLLTLHDADIMWEPAKFVAVDNDRYGIDSYLGWSFNQDRQQC